jgi:hypothetical protein
LPEWSGVEKERRGEERGGEERGGEERGEGGGARKELSLHNKSGTYSIMPSVNSNVGGRGFWMFQIEPRAHSGGVVGFECTVR